jgi:hypothetical protein
MKVQRHQCETCIYKSGLSWPIEEYENAIRDPHMNGFFSGHRICHHSDEAICAGFWARHKDHFTLGQLAQRLGLVEKIDHDKSKEDT